MKIYLIDNNIPIKNKNQLEMMRDELCKNFKPFRVAVNANRNRLQSIVDNGWDLFDTFNCEKDLILMNYEAISPEAFVEQYQNQFGTNDFYVIDLCLTKEEEDRYSPDRATNPSPTELSGYRCATVLRDIVGVYSKRIVLMSKLVQSYDDDTFGSLITKPFMRLRTDDLILRPGNVSVRGKGMPRCLGVANYVMDFCYKIYSKAFGLNEV